MTKLRKIPVPIYMYTNTFSNTIKRVKIIKQTDHSVFFENKGRSLKTTQHSIYRDTEQEVLDWIERGLKNAHDTEMRRVAYTQDKLDKFLEYKKEVENDIHI